MSMINDQASYNVVTQISYPNFSINLILCFSTNCRKFKLESQHKRSWQKHYDPT